MLMSVNYFIHHFLDLSVSNVINGPQDNFGTCPRNSYVFSKFDTEYCCCENGCCWDKCTSDPPPKSCLDGIPNTVWEYNNVLGYYQAVKGFSSNNNDIPDDE